MAMVISSSPQASSFRSNKPWMLKDFLLDDLGSCSSSGFRSFPRRQCCLAVRSLIQMEVANTSTKANTKSTSRPRLLKSPSTISAAIHRASLALTAAVKLLPFTSDHHTPRKKKSLLPRSLSKRLFGRGRLYWKKASSSDDRTQIERWVSSDLSSSVTASTLITSTSAASRSSSDGWSDPDTPNGTVLVQRKSKATPIIEKNWNNEGEREQLSPVSVLNFPDEDEEIGSSPPFTRKLSCLEGTKDKLMQKLRRFECLSRTGKINLEARNRISLATDLIIKEEEETNEKAVVHLLNHVKAKTMSSNGQNLNAGALLVDFFQERLDKASSKNCKLVEGALLIEAEDWLCGRSPHNEVSLGWKGKDKRKVYVKDIEEAWEWRSNVHELEKEEVVVRVEAEVLSSLVEEVVGEFSNIELLNFLFK